MSRFFEDNNLRAYGPVFLRYAMVLVFLYFPISQLVDPIQWVGYVPEFITNFMSANTLILLNAIFELILLILLGLGYYTRWSSLLLGLHLVGIVVHIGFNQTGVRDLGLAVALFGVAFNGPDKYCLEKKSKS